MSSETDLGLFDSGLLPPGSSYSFTFFASGKYTAVDAANANTGLVSVPVQVFPASGTIATLFAILWATDDAPPGYAYDVQVLVPGASAFTGWRPSIRKGVGTFSSADLNFSGAGTYVFRARIRNTNNGVASGWSNNTAITIG